jgi:hypothetical protein
VAALAASAAWASSGPKGVTCTGSLSSGTISHQLTVPNGAICTLTFPVVIDASVVLQKGGALLDTGATITGNVTSTRAAWIDLRGGTIKGNLQLSGTTGQPPAALDPSSTGNDLCNLSVLGNVKISTSAAGAPWVVGALSDCTVPITVGGNLTVNGNAGSLLIGPAINGAGDTVKGITSVTGNTGGGSLSKTSSAVQCKLLNNTPGIVGSGNTGPLAKKNSCNATA